MTRPQLLDRQAVLDIVADHPAILAIFEALEPVKPTVVANITRGLLQGASSDYPVEIHTLDFDVESFDAISTGIRIDGSDAYRAACVAEYEPDFIREVLEAPEIYFADGEPVEED